MQAVDDGKAELILLATTDCWGCSSGRPMPEIDLSERRFALASDGDIRGSDNARCRRQSITWLAWAAAVYRRRYSMQISASAATSLVGVWAKPSGCL